MLQWGRDQVIAEMLREGQGIALVQTLQWGRDQVIAEMEAAQRLIEGGYVLQWGRDQVIAEIWRARLDARYFPGFNGAAIR